MGFRLKKPDNLGFGLVEALIATGIFAVIVAIITQYFTQSHAVAIKIEGVSGCRSQVESLLAQYGDNSSVNITNYIEYADVPGTRSLASSMGDMGTIQDFAAAVSGTNPQYPQYRNYQNIENSVTRAFLLLKNDGAFCNDPSGDGLKISNDPNSPSYKEKVLPNPALWDSLDAQNKDVYLKITPMGSGAALGQCSQTDVSPLSTSNSAVNRVFQLQFKVVNRLNKAETCVGSTTLKYDGDTKLPDKTAAQKITAANCGVSAHMEATEPGSMFECSIAGGPWVLCDSAHISSSGMNSATGYEEVLNPGPGQSTTQANIGIGGFPNPSGSIHVDIRAIDTSGNRAPASAYAGTDVSCCIDTSWSPSDPSTVCFGTSVATKGDQCGAPGAPLWGSKCGGGCANAAAKCEGPNLVTRNNCGTVLSSVPSASCASGCGGVAPTAKCEGSDMVTRDCNGIELSRIIKAAACTSSPPTCTAGSTSCQGSNLVTVDGSCNVTTTSICDPSCVTVKAPACEGKNLVTRDSCNVIKNQVNDDPSCVGVPRNFSATMTCGRRGCSSAAYSSAAAYVASLQAAGIITAGDASAADSSMLSWYNSPPIENCISSCGGGLFPADGSVVPSMSGGAFGSFHAEPTADAYLNPYRCDFGACSITFTFGY